MVAHRPGRPKPVGFQRPRCGTTRCDRSASTTARLRRPAVSMPSVSGGGLRHDYFRGVTVTNKRFNALGVGRWVATRHLPGSGWWDDRGFNARGVGRWVATSSASSTSRAATGSFNALGVGRWVATQRASTMRSTGSSFNALGVGRWVATLPGNRWGRAGQTGGCAPSSSKRCRLASRLRRIGRVGGAELRCCGAPTEGVGGVLRRSCTADRHAADRGHRIIQKSWRSSMTRVPSTTVWRIVCSSSGYMRT